MHKFGKKTLSWLFAGYVQQAGGFWNGDVLVIDWDELDGAEVARERAEGGVTLRRVKAKEICVQRHGYLWKGIASPLLRQR